MSSDEEEVNAVSHKNLLSEINDIVKFQHVKKPKRSEPSVKISEFHLVKSKADNDSEEVKYDKKTVFVKSVASIVRKNENQKKIGNQLQATFKEDKVLKRPLEKVHSDRIQRTVAYDNTRNKLSRRWDAIVTKNKNAEQLHFPLTNERVRFTIDKEEPAFSQFRYKTQMMKDIEEINNECFPKAQNEEKDEISNEILTLEEIKERRREIARLKLKESQKIAKKRLQGKIKSKKYHRLRKRDELERKLKDFEELKISNPEAALKELEKIEKYRIQERANLRHKNTGTWAKNMKVRAQYDDTAKQELEAQLALGRELTQKNQNNDSSGDSEDEEMVTTGTLADNPWLESVSKGNDLDEIFSGYRKFWEEKNKVEKKKKKLVKMPEPVEEVINESSSDDPENISEKDNSAWVEEDLSGNDDSNYIENLFDKAEEEAISNFDSKLMNLKPKLLDIFEKKNTNKKKKNGKNLHDPKYLEFVKEAKLADVDVALNEGSDPEVEEKMRPSKRLLKEINEIKEERKAFMRGTVGGEIDPHSFLNVKSKHLLTAIPKSQEFDDFDEDEMEDLSKSNKLSLAEAFENDDIINDFIEETEVTSKNEDVNQCLPGWGSWGGHNVKKNRQKVEKPLALKRKDRIIINNAPNEKLRKHLISSVPFPFTTVKDFEASMRLPVGKDFVPESAFRKLTAPSVVTKSGTIIEPMTEDVLVQNNRKTNRNGNILKKL